MKIIVWPTRLNALKLQQSGVKKYFIENMTNLNSHTIANQSKILTKYFKLGSYRAILAATLRIWHFFFTFIPSVVLQEMTKKVHSSIHSSNFPREISSALRLRFRKCLASSSFNSISPVTKQQRQEALCFVSPPLSGMVRRHYWSENWLHIYQSNLVDFKSRPYPRQQQVITWLSWCLTYFFLGSISMPLSHLRQQQGSRL